MSRTASAGDPGVRHQGEVLLDREVGEDRAALGDRAQPDPGQLLGGGVLDVDAAEVDVAGRSPSSAR